MVLVRASPALLVALLATALLAPAARGQTINDCAATATTAAHPVCPTGSQCVLVSGTANRNPVYDCGSATTRTTTQCPTTAGFAKCGNKCVDTRTDPDNCGACGVNCGHAEFALGSVCRASQCQCPAGNQRCQVGTTNKFVCANINNDEQHCGGCNRPCPKNAVCDGPGECRCVAPYVLDEMDNACINPLFTNHQCHTDRDGVQPRPQICPQGSTCGGEDLTGVVRGGQCIFTGEENLAGHKIIYDAAGNEIDRIPVNFIGCNGEKVNPLTDSRHCGSCDNTATDGRCVNGELKCEDNFLVCDGVCWNKAMLNTMDNCGFCGTVCHSTQVCMRNSEIPFGPLPDPHTLQAEEYACACPPGKHDCGDGICRDLQTDDLYCGACAPEGTIGFPGADIPNPNTPLAGGTACPANAECARGQCACKEGFTKCGGLFQAGQGVCVDTKNDPKNCGGCGKRAPAGTTCKDGKPVCNDPNLTLCGNKCVNTKTDPLNCGGCSQSTAATTPAAINAAANTSPRNCASKRATTCVNGACQCASGWGFSTTGATAGLCVR